MQTSDRNVNNTESDHATAIFRQFQDAIFSRELTSVKTLTKIIFDLLQWQEIATLSLPKKAAIASFISTTFRGYFCLRANDIARNRSRVIFSRACADIFRRWTVVGRDYFSHASSYRENVACARRVLTITFMLTIHTGKEVGKFRGNWLEQSVEDPLVYEGNFNDQNSPKCIMDRVSVDPGAEQFILRRNEFG